MSSNAAAKNLKPNTIASAFSALSFSKRLEFLEHLGLHGRAELRHALDTLDAHGRAARSASELFDRAAHDAETGRH